MTETPACPGIRLYCFQIPEAGSTQVLGATSIGDVNTGFSEQTTAHFLLPTPGEWSLRVDDEPLPLVETTSGLAWAWTPGFYAGEVTAELVDPAGGVRSRVLFDVAPHPLKLGRDVFAEMVHEIWDWDPGLVLGEEPASTRAGALGAHQGLLIAFARLRRHAPSAVKSLQRIAQQPIRRLRARRDRVPLCRARRIDVASIRSLARSPELSAALAGEGFSPLDALDPGAVLDIPAVEHDIDCAPNRAITAVSRRLLARVRSVRGQYQEAVERDNPSLTRTPLAARWAVRR